MFSNCGRSSGFCHSRRRLVNISSTGLMALGLSRLPIVTKTVPGKLSKLVVKASWTEGQFCDVQEKCRRADRPHVRFGSEADIRAANSHVRFTSDNMRN